jgi:phytoene/squalene synthetase
MDLYDKVAYENSRHLTLNYSTSFGMSSRFFSKQIQPHIYAVYGLVRIADEIVDTYKGPDAEALLDDLEKTTYVTLKNGYSTNPIVHAFGLTARRYGIGTQLIKPFFESMRMDLHPQDYSPKNYQKYIYGSAEVVGLMCLRVFCDGNNKQYESLREGASALGAAYQKVNFLRDMAADYKELGRLYFPGSTFETFGEKEKQIIIKDIKRDFEKALLALRRLPESSRKATMLSYVYYSEIFKKLETTPVETIKTSRIRIPNSKKFLLMAATLSGTRGVK